MRKGLFITVILLISLFFTACVNESNDISNSDTQLVKLNLPKEKEIVDNGPRRGGLVNLFSTRPDSLNPIISTNTYVQDFSPLIYEGLFKLSKNQSPEPLLCDKWDVSADGLIWNLHIRENVSWHDGTILSAEDVKFTFDTILYPSSSSIFKKNLLNIAYYAPVDSYNLRIILKQPDSFLPENLTFPILSKAYYAGDDVFKLNSVKNMTPVGTGPYKFISRQNDIISLKANESWWNKRNDKDNSLDTPYIANINLKLYKSSEEALAAFQTRDIDAAILPLSDFNKYYGRSDLFVRKFVSKNFEFLALNNNDPILSEKAVRQAIAYTIDKNRIINDIMIGQATSSDFPIIQDSWLNSENTNFFSQDKTKAKEILLNGGWTEEKKGLTTAFYKKLKGIKTELKLDIMVNEFDTVRYKVAEYIAGELKDIGIDVMINKLSQDNENKALQTNKYKMAILGYRISSVPDVAFAYASYSIASGLNVSGYNSPVTDSLLVKIRQENDLERKKVLVDDLKAVISDDVPFVGLYFYNNAVIFNKKIRGDVNPVVWDKFNDITKWYMLDKN